MGGGGKRIEGGGLRGGGRVESSMLRVESLRQQRKKSNLTQRRWVHRDRAETGKRIGEDVKRESH